MESHPVEVFYTLAGWGPTCIANGEAQESFNGTSQNKVGHSFRRALASQPNAYSNHYDLLTPAAKSRLRFVSRLWHG